MGLQLVLDQHTNLDSLQTVHEPGLGLKVLVSQPGAFPLLGQDSLLLAPGQSHNLRLDATVVRSTKAVASLNEVDRECVATTGQNQGSLFSAKIDFFYTGRFRDFQFFYKQYKHINDALILVKSTAGT